MLFKKAIDFLKQREFINVGTCDFQGRPNVAPKLLLKIEGHVIYLIDYILGKTYRTYSNLKLNPRASLAFLDIDTLTGYQINGPAEIIEEGPVYTTLLKELSMKKIELSVKRIIEGVNKEKKHKAFEVALPEKVVIFKIQATEIVEISASGKLEREKV
jgi:predicted pyridoxine 5'-phosphate oxidase superfamily flavin-nucleotide-binding protein